MLSVRPCQAASLLYFATTASEAYMTHIGPVTFIVFFYFFSCSEQFVSWAVQIISKFFPQLEVALVAFCFGLYPL